MDSNDPTAQFQEWKWRQEMDGTFILYSISDRVMGFSRDFPTWGIDRNNVYLYGEEAL